MSRFQTKRRRNLFGFGKQETYHSRIVRPKASQLQSYMGVKIYHVYEPVEGYTTSIDRDSIHDSLADAKAFIKSWKKNPAQFDRCVADVKKSLKKYGRAGNAYAICRASGVRANLKKRRRNVVPLDITTAYLMPGTFSTIDKERKVIAKKFGGKKRKRNPRNPIPDAQDRYEAFHGRPSEQLTTVRTTMHEHSVLAGIGELRKMVILTPDGKYKVILRFAKPYPILSMNEAATQLFIEGGDQSVDLKEFGIEDAHESEVLGTLRDIYYYTTKDHLGPEDGGTAVYKHKFGTKHLIFGKRRTPRPTVLYDVPNRLLSIAGGGYSIPDEGIDG